MSHDCDFERLSLYASYYTSEHQIGKIFYTPVLEKATSYDRVSGYFSSKALASYAQGVKGLINNGGRMRLIVSEELSEEDVRLMREGYALREKTIDNLLGRLDDSLDEQEMMDYCNLAHLIANGVVDIRIGFKTSGLFHSKFGLVEDGYGNVIYFTGSNNETSAAIENNFESFDITTTWLSSSFDGAKIHRARREFDMLWADRMREENIYVKHIEELIIKKILTYDKGKIILDKEMLREDAMILTIDDGQLIVHDNVLPGKIREKERTITTKLKWYYTEQGFPHFRPDLTYVEIKKVIEHLKNLGAQRDFDVVVTSALEDYLERQTYLIGERSDYAMLLKTQDERIVGKYSRFMTIVNRELHRQLRDKQMQSAFYMAEMHRAANFSVPGAGKTSMVYGTFAYLSAPEIDKVDKVIMIGPKNTFLAWKDEYVENFGAKRKLHLLNVHETDDPIRQLRLGGGSFDLILVNYESLGRFEGVLNDVIDDRTMLVFDEVHKIKGIKSKRAQVAMRLSTLTRYKYVLTGTPIPNTYEDVYNFLNLLYGEDYKSFFNFKPSDLKNPSATRVTEINDKLLPFFWRTTKAELQVPQAEPDIFHSEEANDDEQAIIDLVYRKYMGNPFSMYIRLLQASTCPELLLRALDFEEMYDEEASGLIFAEREDTPPVTLDRLEVELLRRVPTTQKFRAGVELVSDLHDEGKTAVVWCMFVHTIDRFRAELLAKGIKAEAIYGSTPLEERERIIKSFQAGELDVIVTNPHTLAESVSLHHVCHDAVYLEYSFNLTHMLQSRDRIHRLGLPQGQYTRYHYMMMQGQPEENGMVDEKIYDRLKLKERRMLDAIENGELRPDPTVDYDEIVSLFD
ncbi:SNF2-related protein [Exiguobacterium acetylicum]|uniref:SNF2-related protein n=1 Tax=Exiguobacterium acetylicum TaxID=41170 RepID=UPI0027DF448E|nr:SNF2-related protein [Exiguobacterium acetylicum]MDQ6468853.1 SNF2-related protein [Exiguobacterium acetylicum]